MPIWWFVSMKSTNASANTSFQAIRWLTQTPGRGGERMEDDLLSRTVQTFGRGGHCLTRLLHTLWRFEICWAGQRTSGKLVGERSALLRELNWHCGSWELRANNVDMWKGRRWRMMMVCLTQNCSGVLVLIHLIFEVQEKATFYFQLSVCVLIAINIVCLQWLCMMWLW